MTVTYVYPLYGMSYQEICNNPETANHNKIWLKDEDDLLLNEIKNKCSSEQIAKTHKRTIDGIEYRKVKLAINMIKRRGKQTVCDIFDFNIDQLNDYVRNYKKYKKISLTKKTDYVEDNYQQSSVVRLLNIVDTLTKVSEELILIIALEK